VLAIAIMVALGIAAVLGWWHGRWAFPWPGVGDEVESFEDLLALRLVAFPAALAALLITGGFLAYRYYWDGTFFDPAKHDPCACPDAGTEKKPACVPVCRETPSDGNFAPAIERLTKAVNGVTEKLDGNGTAAIARTLAAIEQTLTALNASMAKVGPASADLLDRLDKLRTGLQAVAEAIAKPTTPPWADRLDAIEKALREIALKSGTAPADLLNRLDKLQTDLATLGRAAGKPAPVAPPELLEHLDGIERALRALPVSPGKPDLAAADLLDRLDKLRAGLQAVAEAIAKPTTPPWADRLDAIEKALREIALKSGTAPADLLNRLDKLQTDLATLGRAAGKPAPAAPPELLEHLDGIERALRALPVSPGKPDPAAADLLDRLDKLQAALHPLAAMPELLPWLDAIEKALRRIAGNGPGEPPVLPPSQLDAIVKILTAIQISVGKGAALDTVIEHLTLIEAILSDLPYPSPSPCGPVPGFTPLAEPTPGERQLMDLAKRRGLTTAQQYRITKRQILFDPKANQPSEIGMRLLRLTAETARKRGVAVVIRAEADDISDGADAEAMARQRAAAVADYLAQPAPVPLVGIGLATPVGAASEPYRRIVRIDLLEPCPAPAKRDRALEAVPKTQ